MKKNAIIILGTRPELIKTALIVKELQKLKTPVTIWDTQQQSTPLMKDNFVKTFSLQKSIERLPTKNCFSQIPYIISQIKKRGITDVIVQGDTNSALIGAISAKHANVKLHHVEAGLRSFDDRMREEHNRVMIDSVSDELYAPSLDAMDNLERCKGKIHVIGNTVNDALKFILKGILQNIVKDRQLSENDFFNSANRYQDQHNALITLHRPENVDNKQSLMKCLSFINAVCEQFKSQLYGERGCLLLHPRTKQKIREFNINIDKYKFIHFEKPIGYEEMIARMLSCKFVISDSGGLAEETNYLKLPMITLRSRTERVETITDGTNYLVDPDYVGNEFFVKLACEFINNFKLPTNRSYEVEGVNPSEYIARHV
jgi:UDP-N-acetylglucosamine 2-epimerase